MIDFLFNPNGRASRGQIWIRLVLPQLAASILAAVFDSLILTSIALADSPTIAPVFGLSTAVTLFFFWPNIAVPIKRFHDRGMSGWWVLWFALIVLGGLVVALASMFSASDFQTAFEAAQKGVEATPQLASGDMAGAASFAALALLVAVAGGLTQFVILYLLPGEDGANRFGPDPRDGGSRARRGAPEETRSEWADRLADPGKLAAAAAAVGGKDDKTRPALARGARSGQAASWPAMGPSPRPTFGRRGV